MNRLFPPLMAFALMGCQAPETDQLFNDIQVSVTDASGVSAAFVAEVEAATDTLHIALPDGDDAAITGAILAAFESGIDVEMVIDYDQSQDPGLVALINAGVSVQLADQGKQLCSRQGADVPCMAYFDFALNADVQWFSDEVTMTQSYVIADRTTGVCATSAGGVEAGSRVVLDIRGESLVEDILTEHLQLFGGADATAVTAFNSPQKSIADVRWAYPGTSDAVIEMWLGPQERLTKRMIDAVYGAKASVWVLSGDFGNSGFSKALQDKAAWKNPNNNNESYFDMRVVVGPNFGVASPGPSALLRDATADVFKRQVTDAVVPTLVIVDAGDSRAPDGSLPSPRAFLLTHPIYSSARLHEGGEVVNDQLLDGTLWVFNDWDAHSPEMEKLIALFKDHWERGDSL